MNFSDTQIVQARQDARAFGVFELVALCDAVLDETASEAARSLARECVEAWFESDDESTTAVFD